MWEGRRVWDDWITIWIGIGGCGRIGILKGFQPRPSGSSQTGYTIRAYVDVAHADVSLIIIVFPTCPPAWGHPGPFQIQEVSVSHLSVRVKSEMKALMRV